MFSLLLKLFITFFKIGVFTFGGGYAMIPLITQEVLNNNWVDNTDVLIDFIAIAESTPGTFAINIATFIGFEQVGVIGAIAATLGVILPSFIIILIIASLFTKSLAPEVNEEVVTRIVLFGPSLVFLTP